jgi:hypothetical protein
LQAPFGAPLLVIQVLDGRAVSLASTCVGAAFRAICISVAGCVASRSTLARMDSVMKAAKPKAVTRVEVRVEVRAVVRAVVRVVVREEGAWRLFM